jgi:hypothetical protein
MQRNPHRNHDFGEDSDEEEQQVDAFGFSNLHINDHFGEEEEFKAAAITTPSVHDERIVMPNYMMGGDS